MYVCLHKYQIMFFRITAPIEIKVKKIESSEGKFSI